MKLSNNDKINKCMRCLEEGDVIAYPTESCFGLGCDPNNNEAINRIYNLKDRPSQMPFIIIIGQWTHLAHFNCAITDDQRKLLNSSWPGPVTWLIPLKTPHRLSSKTNKIAVRMTNHPVAKSLCDHWNGPIVSTSANPHGFASAKNASDVIGYFGDKVSFIYDGPIGKRKKPSDIFDLETNTKVR